MFGGMTEILVIHRCGIEPVGAARLEQLPAIQAPRTRSAIRQLGHGMTRVVCDFLLSPCFFAVVRDIDDALVVSVYEKWVLMFLFPVP